MDTEKYGEVLSRDVRRADARKIPQAFSVSQMDEGIRGRFSGSRYVRQQGRDSGQGRSAGYRQGEYKNIGIALDFSGNDQKIIQSALKQGGKSATYTFIHVVESAAARYLGKNTMDYETQLDRESLNKYQQILKEMGYTANLQIGFGKAANEIAKIVSTMDIDFLVMGVHGHKGLKDLIFGTTVDSVRHKIKIPILVVN